MTSQAKEINSFDGQTTNNWPVCPSKLLIYSHIPLSPWLCNAKQEGHDGPVSLHWLIREIHSYQTLHYLGIGLKHKTPYKD